MRRLSICALTALAAASLAGCAGGEQPAVCDSLEAVQTSLDHVRNANVSETGLGQLRGDLNQLRLNLDQLVSEAQDQFPVEVGTVRSAADQVAATVNDARAEPAPGTLSDVRTAVNGLGDAVDGLRASMSQTC